LVSRYLFFIIDPKKLSMKKTQKVSAVLILFLVVLTTGAAAQARIAVSKLSSNYEKWLLAADPDVAIINMYGMTVDSAMRVLASCHGLLLTGGEDVNPAYYGKVNERSKCEEINGYRDTLEMALIQRALMLRMPVFGICRGEQILNVALGGTLHTDIPTDMGTKVIHRCPPGSTDCLHSVSIDKESDLFEMTKVDNGIVNSYHHQAVDMVAPGMKVTARSENGVSEAIEREMPLGKSFVMGVQWHPEALKANQGLSKPLADTFIEKVLDYRQDKRNCCGAH
jgi:putative glutamine amidotransferase